MWRDAYLQITKLSRMHAVPVRGPVGRYEVRKQRHEEEHFRGDKVYIVYMSSTDYRYANAFVDSPDPLELIVESV